MNGFYNGRSVIPDAEHIWFHIKLQITKLIIEQGYCLYILDNL